VSKTISRTDGGGFPQVRLHRALAPHSRFAGLLNASATLGMRLFVALSGVHASPAAVTGCSVAVPESR
jgi:hypothetical protein